jgi:hypothetical protein
MVFDLTAVFPLKDCTLMLSAAETLDIGVMAVSTIASRIIPIFFNIDNTSINVNNCNEIIT